MISILRKTVEKLVNSSALDKSRLFVKTLDLVGGSTRLAPIERKVKEIERDIIGKGVLMKTGPIFHCRRCGGQSEVGINLGVAGHTSVRWRVWERTWATRCICGGLWSAGPA
jgi:hypothetical protein